MFFTHDRTYIIAEAGVNHNGSEEIARHLVDIAAEARADAVKFQLFNPEALVTAHAPTAEYQARNLNDTQVSQRAMLEALTLPQDAYIRLAKYCAEAGVDFLCTPFDAGSLAFLTQHTSMRYLKLPSGEITNAPLLVAAARTGLPIILSTGMAELTEVGEALAWLHAGYTHTKAHPTRTLSQANLIELQGKVALLHCVSDYPAPASATNLRALDTLRKNFGLPVGLSDHSLGLNISIAAAARGASIIEKHFTYDVAAHGPDHAASLPPQGLKALVDAVREVESALGDGIKQCHPTEMPTRIVARKSLVAASPIPAGTPFSESMLTEKRPGNGLAPKELWGLLGKPAARTYVADELIDIGELT